MKTCPICNEKNDDTERFCSKCGNEVNKSETPSHAENLQQTSNKETGELKTENSSRNNIIPFEKINLIDQAVRGTHHDYLIKTLLTSHI